MTCDRSRTSSKRLLTSLLLGLVSAGPACSGPPSNSSPTAHTAASADASTLSPASATAAAIARAAAELDRYRTAAGGVAVSAIRGIEVIGVSTSTSTPGPRILHLYAQFPTHFRQEEAPGSEQVQAAQAQSRRAGGGARRQGPLGRSTPPAVPSSPQVILVLEGETGWMGGNARLAAPGTTGSGANPTTVAARQALVNFMAGALPSWLDDSKRITFTYDDVVNAGVDRGAIVLRLDGADGHAGRLLIDPDTHLPRRLIVDREKALGNAAVGVTITFSDFRAVDGVQLPHTFMRETDTGIRTTWKVAHYVLNGKIAPQVFMQPASRGRAGGGR